ncbi:MAG: thrombospondin type 3 repeat-containing protein, partial [Myxococcales bacterium]|nr:thrombospondin type 3 repeat-containing protein [Myxococcales bacterium]
MVFLLAATAFAADVDRDDVVDCAIAGVPADCTAVGAVAVDNCPGVYNPSQHNFDGDALGDACDPDDDNDALLDGADPDDDDDGTPDTADNCRTNGTDPSQSDFDGDGWGDVCDNCPFISNQDQLDSNSNGIGNLCDSGSDTDGDTVADDTDVCPAVSDTPQTDTDMDGRGDACDDHDYDGVLDVVDNCPNFANPDQADANSNMIGDLCDSGSDSDLDGAADNVDNCPGISNAPFDDSDGDGLGDLCDFDDDGDDVIDCAVAGLPADCTAVGAVAVDNCPGLFNPDQHDPDNDNIGSACDTGDTCTGGDPDGDGVLSNCDNCPAQNFDQTDSDSDGAGNFCDGGDTDGDGVTDSNDTCPAVAGPQLDTDGDGRGDICDDDDDDDGLSDSDEALAGTNPFNPDTDGDFIDDATEVGPNPATPRNTDSDLLIDALDLDSDGDGWLDSQETNDEDLATPPTDSGGTPSLPDYRDLNSDGDATPDAIDNCRATSSGSQADNDLDGAGDVCDLDDDNDGTTDSSDNCPFIANNQGDNYDSDSLGDACDPDIDNDNVLNADDSDDFDETVCRDIENGIGDGCDDCSSGIDNTFDDGNDLDGDGICTGTSSPLNDNCPTVSNASQLDSDGDGNPLTCVGSLCGGDACDQDDDNDGSLDTNDLFPTDPLRCHDLENGIGDGCDDCSSGTFDQLLDGPDADSDLICDSNTALGDNCKFLQNTSQLDTDGDGSPLTCTNTLCGGNACDDDDDNDGVIDSSDNAPLDPTLCQDLDGDTCDDCAAQPGKDQLGPNPDNDVANDGADADADGICDAGDNCINDSNASQLNTDGDAQGDACDPDDDNDGVVDGSDNAPTDPTHCQDTENGVGDGCDDCSNPNLTKDGFGSASDVDINDDGADADGDGICDLTDNCLNDGNFNQADNDSDTGAVGCQVNQCGGDVCDLDDDNDGIADTTDSFPLDPTKCQDVDGDDCDDCTASLNKDGLLPNPDNDPADDGLDSDGDGLCNDGGDGFGGVPDPDNDND